MENYTDEKSDLEIFIEFNRKFVPKLIAIRIKKIDKTSNILAILDSSGKLDKKAFELLYTNVSERKIAEDLAQNKSWVTRKKKKLKEFLRL